MIFPRGFKLFISTLTKTEIQTRSSPERLKRLPVQSWESKSIWSPKYFEIHISQLQSFENFGRSSVDCLKINKDKSSDANFTPTWRSHSNTNADLAPNYKYGPQSVQHLNSNAKVNQIRVLTQTQSSTKSTFQFKHGAQLSLFSSSKVKLS